MRVYVSSRFIMLGTPAFVMPISSLVSGDISLIVMMSTEVILAFRLTVATSCSFTSTRSAWGITCPQNPESVHYKGECVGMHTQHRSMTGPLRVDKSEEMMKHVRNWFYTNVHAEMFSWRRCQICKIRCMHMYVCMHMHVCMHLHMYVRV